MQFESGATPARRFWSNPLKRNQLILSAALLGLAWADWELTRFIIKNGYAWEGNPLIRAYIAESNFGVVKILGTLLALLLLWDIFHRHQKLAQVFTSIFVVFYSLVVLWNGYLALTGIWR